MWSDLESRKPAGPGTSPHSGGRARGPRWTCHRPAPGCSPCRSKKSRFSKYVCNWNTGTLSHEQGRRSHPYFLAKVLYTLPSRNLLFWLKLHWNSDRSPRVPFKNLSMSGFPFLELFRSKFKFGGLSKKKNFFSSLKFWLYIFSPHLMELQARDMWTKSDTRRTWNNPFIIN